MRFEVNEWHGHHTISLNPSSCYHRFDIPDLSNTYDIGIDLHDNLRGTRNRMHQPDHSTSHCSCMAKPHNRRCLKIQVSFQPYVAKINEKMVHIDWIPSSQKVPLNPCRQAQKYLFVLNSGTHVPLFLHGSFSHGLVCFPKRGDLNFPPFPCVAPTLNLRAQRLDQSHQIRKCIHMEHFLSISTCDKQKLLLVHVVSNTNSDHLDPPTQRFLQGFVDPEEPIVLTIGHYDHDICAARSITSLFRETFIQCELDCLEWKRWKFEFLPFAPVCEELSAKSTLQRFSRAAAGHRARQDLPLQ